MVGKAKAPTKAEQDRLTTLKEHCPCLPCLLLVRKIRLPTIQHIVRGQKRLGHKYTYSSCGWHHLGDTEGMETQAISGLLGPSIAHGRRNFEENFGSELEVLLPVQNFILDAFETSPWFDYDLPYYVRTGAQDLWISLKK